MTEWLLLRLDDWPADAREECEERAAIRQHMGKASRAVAEAAARQEVIERRRGS
jgi:hypothetical protein